MAIASDKTKEYLQMLEEKFNINKFYEFIKDLLNLENENIVNGNWQKATSEQYKNYIDTTQLFAEYEDDKRRKIGVLIIKLQDNKHPANARTMQRNYIAHLLDAYNLDASLSAIYSNADDTWRLSFVRQEIDFSEGKLKSKFTPAKRYSYLFGKDEPNHTAKKQLVDFIEKNDKKYTIEEIEEKFSVEKVTKDFFENYKENYLKLKEILESNEEFISESKRCDFTSEEFTKKLMGQIVFIYFLQKKGWLGVKLVPQVINVKDFEDIYKNSDVIQKKILDKYYITFNNTKKIKKELLERYNENKQEIENLSDIFVNAKFDCKWGTGEKRFIRKIFENCVNRNKNFFDNYLEPFFYDALNNKRKNQYFSLFNCKIPFLNGGLFEPLDNYQWQIAKFNIDNEIFSNKEKTGILDFFDRYNFTMDEEEPLEKDVAVDPEMLGKIFENLLDVKDRKSKGAFYTPREIVHYMCQESIANFLVNKVGVDYNEIKEFIQYGEMIRDVDLKEATKDSYLVGKTIFKNIVKIDNALEHIKIADPAVGSGAFPLGILNEIVKLRDILTSYMLIYNRLGLFGKKYSEEQITNYKRSIYQLKWNTIKNSIYAVDIENSAIDITKLRLWLSIVVDQNDDPEPLPNLNCKIMQGNSLIDEYAGIKLIDKKFIDELKDRQNVTFNNGGKIKSGKKMIEVSSNQIQFGDGQKKAQIDDLINLKLELYGENDPERKKILLEKIQTARKELLKLNFIGTNKEKELFEIDKSHNKPYFAWRLEFIEVFIENDGFDIIIGNPPYIGQKGHKELFEQMSNNENFEKKMDYWYFFLHNAYEMTNEIGIVSYITPNYWITAQGGKKLRNRIVNDFSFIKYINFNENKIFSAGIHTNVFVLSKIIKQDNEVSVCIFDNNYENDFIKHMSNQNNFKIKQDILLNKWTRFVNFIDTYNLNLLNKMTQNCEKLCDNESEGKSKKGVITGKKVTNGICNLNQGLVTGKDRLITEDINKGVFILYPEEISALALDDDEKRYIKPFYKNSDIKQYWIDKKSNTNILYVNNINDEAELKKHHNIYQHLLKYKDILLERSVNGVLKSAFSKGKWWALTTDRPNIKFDGENIVFPQRSKINKFAYSNNEFYSSADIYYMSLNKEEYDLKYILAILNSKLMYFWLYWMGKRKGEALELYLEPLQFVPIKKISKEEQISFIKIVNQILKDKKNKEVLKSELDKKIYKLYNLNEEEINYIEEFYNKKISSEDEINE